MTMKERLPRILEISLRLLPQIRANADDGDSTGVSLASLMGNLAHIGVADFVLSANIAKFKECLSDAAKVRLRLFERHVNGEPIAASLVAMLSYQEVFDALAARDFGTAEKLATLMGGRPGLEKEHDHPFDYCLGYTLKSFVERDESAMVEWAGKFEDLCRTKGNGDFAGYAKYSKQSWHGTIVRPRAGLKRSSRVMSNNVSEVAYSKTTWTRPSAFGVLGSPIFVDVMVCPSMEFRR